MSRFALRWLVPDVLRERFALKFAVSLIVLALPVAALGIGAAFSVSRNGIRYGIAATILSVGLVALVGYYLGRDTATAVTELSEKAEQLERGNYDVDFTTDRVDTIGQLYRSFGSMATTLSERERSLQAERDRLAALFENTSDCIARVELGEEPVVRDVNRRFEERFGYDSDEIRGESLRDTIVPADRMAETEEIIQKVRRGERFEDELRRQTADGMGDFLFRFVPISNDYHETDQIEGYAVYTDITDRKQAQRTLETSNQSLRRLHEITTDRRTDFEATIERLLELGCEQADLDVGILSHIEDDRYEVIEAVDPAGAVTAGDVFDLSETICEFTVMGGAADVVTLSDIGSDTYETHPAVQQRDPDAYIGTTVVVDGDTYGTVSFSSESTDSGAFTDSQREVIKLIAQWIGAELERRQRQAALTRNRELLAQSQQLADVGAWELDLETEELVMTDEVYHILDLPLDEDVDLERGVSFYHPEDQERLREAVERAIEEREGYDMEVRFTTATGEERWAHAIGTPIEENSEGRRPAGTRSQTDDGEVVKLRGALQDITEQKRLEQELRTEREHFRVALENSPLVAFRMDTDMRYTWIHNPHDDFQSEDVLGNRDDELLPPDAAEKLMAPKREVLETGESVRKEVTYELPSGEVTYDLTLEPLRDEFGEICGVTGAALDVTERKQHERELERYQEYMDDVLDAIDDVFVIVDEDDHLQRWNGSLSEVTDYTDEELASMHAVELFTEDETEHIENALETLREGDDVRMEADYRTKDGEAVPFEFVATALEDPGGDTILAGIGRDVSERKQHEEELEIAETLFENTQDVLFVMDVADDGEEFYMQRVNPAHGESTGLGNEEIRGREIRDIFGDEEGAALVEQYRECVDRREPLQYEVQLSVPEEGSHWETRLAPVVIDGTVEQLVGATRNITERKQREQELEIAETLFENSQDALFVIDVDEEADEFRFKRVNPAYETTTGFPNEEIRGETPRAVFGDDDGETLLQHYRECVAQREPRKHEVQLSIRDSETCWETRLAPVVIDGTVEKLVGATRNITERKQREGDLERYETVIESVEDAIYTLDDELRFATVNEGMVELTGYSREELLGQRGAMVLDEESAAKARDVRRGLEETDADVRAVELTVVRKDGERVPCEVRISPLSDSEDPHPWTTGVARDISERKAREDELARQRYLLEQAQKIAHVGGWELDFRTDPPYEVTLTEELKRIHEIPPDESFDVEQGIEFYHPEDRPRVRAAVERAVEHGDPYDIEARFITAKGNERWVRTTSEPVYEDGDLIKLRGSLQDITERKEREKELEDQRYLLEQAQELAQVGGWELDVRGDPPYEVSLTEELYRIHGLSPGEDFDLEAGIEMYHPEDREDVREVVTRAIEEGEPYTEESRLIGADGVQRWVRSAGEPEYEDGEVVKLRGALQEITERKERERELEATTERLDSVVSNIPVILYALDDEGTFTLSEGKGLEKLGLEPGEVVGESVYDVYEGRDELIEDVERALDGETLNVVRNIGGVVFESTYQPVFEDGEVTEVIGVSFDITDRKQYEQALESLHDATRELLHTESEAAISETVVDIAEEIIDVPGVGVYLLDSEDNAFAPIATTAGYSSLCNGVEPLPMGDDNSAAWQAFVDGETVSLDDRASLRWLLHEEDQQDRIHTTTRVDPADAATEPDTTTRSGLVVPIGDHGVVTALSADKTVDSRTRQLVETLVATTEAAFDRLESESSLRERDEQLQTRNKRLRRQIEITDIIRNVDQSLIDATSRSEIETAVCERLVESDVISFAWIGGHDTTDEAVVPQTWAGGGQRYLDSVSLTDEDGEPAWQTANEESPTVVGNVLERLRSDPWRRTALEHDFQSVISVPVRHDEYTYGVLTAYAAEPNTFGDLERSVFVELGETVGNAISAVQTKQALYMDSATELKLRFFSEESLLLKLATEADCRVEFDGLSADSGETTRLFFTVTGVPAEEITALLDRLVAVSDYRVISTTDDGDHFEATISEGLVASTLVSHGVRPRSMIADDGELDVIIDVPRETDVREFVELLQDRYQSVELIARRDVERSIGTKADLVESLLDTLTDRQRETLTTAYYSGFFEWPRETTGEEVATMLDVSQPTVNRHLRLAQRSLLGQLFDAEQQPTLSTA